MNTLTLQSSEEAFYRDVVVPSPDTVHVGLDTVEIQQRLVTLVSVLVTLIEMADETKRWLSQPDCHLLLAGQPCM